jgi:hypothetical protein
MDGLNSFQAASNANSTLPENRLGSQFLSPLQLNAHDLVMIDTRYQIIFLRHWCGMGWRSPEPSFRSS